MAFVLALALAACVNKDKDKLAPPAASDAAAPVVKLAAPTIQAAPGIPGTTRAAVYTRLEKDGAGTCDNPGTVLAVGDFKDEEKPTTVPQGSLVDGKPVSIACKVAPNGVGWTVEAKIALPDHGELVLTSPLDKDGHSRAAKVALSRPSDGTWTSDRCELVPEMLKSGGVASGRYVAAIKCREVVNAQVRGAAPMAGTVYLEGCADH